MKIILLLAMAFASLTLAYIRLAPSDPASWHVTRPFDTDRVLDSAALRILPGADRAALARLHDIARSEPRTRVLAGSPAEGKITYISRSAVFGFPDYITIWLADDGLRLWARARFGVSDLGVNAARLDRWVRALTTEQG